MLSVMRLLLSAIFAGALGLGAQDTGVLRITVVVTDVDGNAIPVPRAQLLISDNPTSREPRRVRTGPDGTVEIKLPAGNYTIESDIPVTLGGLSYSWTEMLDVAAGRDTTLALTGSNAAIEAGAGAAAGPRRATPADGAAILHKWQGSIAEIWTPSRHATGFVVDRRGLIATSDRALGEAADVEVEFGTAAGRVKVAGRVVATDRTKGVTIIWIDPAIVQSRQPIAPACTAPGPPPIEHDDKVVTLIAPMLEPKTAVAGTAMRPEAQAFRTDWRLDDGSAGGPVFAADGTAVGITVGGDDDRSQARRQDSYVIPLGNACSVITLAAQAIDGARPPPGALLRTEAGLPAAPAAKIGDAKKPRLQPPVIRADDYDVTLMTPALIGPERNNGTSRSYFGYWAPYVANAPQVLFVRVSPQFEESLWKTLARGAASTQGVALPPMPSFSANFGRMRAFCGAAEVMPIRRFSIEMPVAGRNAVREGLYVFALTDFGAHCGAVRFELFSEKSPGKGDSRVIDLGVLARVLDSSK
jgi:hypothetical protein